MTKEEAKQDLQVLIEYFMEERGATPLCLNFCVEMLEQSEDAVSREAVLKLKHHKPEYGDMIYAFDVEQLPSVQPKRQTGKWKWLTEDKYRCSNCNSETRVDECMNEPMYSFCPFCRADMRGAE